MPLLIAENKPAEKELLARVLVNLISLGGTTSDPLPNGKAGEGPINMNEVA